MTRAQEIANEIRAQDTWSDELSRELCELAGLEEEYDEADSESFERVVKKAANILGVEI